MLLWSLSPIDLTEQMLERISLINPHLKAYHEILVDDCRGNLDNASGGAERNIRWRSDESSRGRS